MAPGGVASPDELAPPHEHEARILSENPRAVNADRADLDLVAPQDAAALPAPSIRKVTSRGVHGLRVDSPPDAEHLEQLARQLLAVAACAPDPGVIAQAALQLLELVRTGSEPATPIAGSVSSAPDQRGVTYAL